MSDARRRVIVNTDAKNEADDQYAIVHALLSPTLDVRGVVPAHFGSRRSDRSMLDSREEVDLLLDLLGMTGQVRVENGAATALPDAGTPVDSPGARLIIEEALREDAGPLQIAFLGPLTDMASALLLEPSIAERDVTVIWIGGAPYDDVVPAYWPEFNLSNDIDAANVVFGSAVDLVQVPMSTYTMVGVGHAELQQKVAGQGPLGKYLVDQLLEWNRTGHHEPIEHRSLGDSPAVSLMLNPGSGHLRRRPAPSFTPDGGYAAGSGRPIRVCEAIDARYLLEDMFTKIADFAAAS